MQSDSCFQILQLARESVRKPRQTAKLHSQGLVLPLNVAGGNVFRVGSSAANLGYNLDDWPWGVPLIPELPIIPVKLGQLGKVGIPGKGFLDSLAIENESIRRQLNPVIRNATAQIKHEVLRVLAGSLSDQKRRNQFGIGVERNVNPLVAKLGRFSLAKRS